MWVLEMEQKMEKIFRLVDNFIWIACRKFFLLQREYLSPTVHVLTNSPKISNITKREMPNSISLRMMKQYDKNTIAQI